MFEDLMVAKGSIPRGPAGPSPEDAGVVRLQKPVPRTDVPTLREKACATCGSGFTVTPDQKFFLCPECYAKEFHRTSKARSSGTQVLTQITCVECGTSEYLSFVPQDASLALCKACYGRRKREQKANPHH